MKTKTALLIAITGLLFGCTGKVVLERTWADPEYAGQPKDNILVVGLAQRHQVRTDFEYHLVSEFKSRGIGAMASVDGMPPEVQLDKEAFARYFGNKGIDAVLITGLVSADTTEGYKPGTSYSLPINYFDTFHGYYVAVYAEHQDPEYWTDHSYFVLESNLYDVASEKLIWQRISEPVTPESVTEIIEDLSKTLVNRLVEDGLVVPEKGKQGKECQVEQAELSDEQMAEMLLRHVSTSPAQFLRSKFSLQWQSQAETEDSDEETD